MSFGHLILNLLEVFKCDKVLIMLNPEIKLNPEIAEMSFLKWYFIDKYKFCPNCGDGYNPCPKCKIDLDVNATICNACEYVLPKVCECGNQCLPDSKFCSNCGKSLSQ